MREDTIRHARVTVADAAERLGISKEAVRKRISRGTLRSDKDADGTVRVYIPASGTPSSTASELVGRDELVEALRDQVEDLRRERDEWRQQARGADRLLSAALERIPPQLELPRDERESPETVAEATEPTEPRSDRPGAQDAVQRPQSGTLRRLRRRLFGW